MKIFISSTFQDLKEERENLHKLGSDHRGARITHYVISARCPGAMGSSMSRI